MGQGDPVEALERELSVLLRRARGSWAQVAREVHPELEPAAYGLMLRLEEVGSARLTDLAVYYGVGKPTVSRQVQLMERLGLVERRADPGDGRAQELLLTPQGLRRVQAVRAARRDQFRALLRTWDAHDVEALGSLLHRFNDVLRQ